MEKSKEIWSILKSIKTKYFLLSNVADVCQARDTFQSNDQINENIDLLQDQLRINRTPEDLSLNDSIPHHPSNRKKRKASIVYRVYTIDNSLSLKLRGDLFYHQMKRN